MQMDGQADKMKAVVTSHNLANVTKNKAGLNVLYYLAKDNVYIMHI
jgi:hypothetical protein